MVWVWMLADMLKKLDLYAGMDRENFLFIFNNQ